jgi:hypothetical protein
MLSLMLWSLEDFVNLQQWQHCASVLLISTSVGPTVINYTHQFLRKCCS